MTKIVYFIFRCLEQTRETKEFETNGWKYSSNLICFLFLSESNFDLVVSFLKNIIATKLERGIYRLWFK